MEVTIDDRLPCLTGRLCFSRCQREDVFWLPLLEKAYAKYACWRRQGPGRAGARAALGCPRSTAPLSLGFSALVHSQGLAARPGVGLTIQRQKPRFRLWLASLLPAHSLLPSPHLKVRPEGLASRKRKCERIVLSPSSSPSRKDVSVYLFLPLGTGGLFASRWGAVRPPRCQSCLPRS